MSTIEQDEQAEEPTRQAVMEIDRYHMRVPFATDRAETPYIPVRALCSYVGLASAMQIKRIKQHDVLARYLRRFNLDTPKGRRPTYCLALRAVGFWLGSIPASHVSAEHRASLLDFQEALMDAAAALLRSDATDTPETPGLSRVRAQLTTHERQLAEVHRFAAGLEQRIGKLEGMVFDPNDVDE